jgi:peptide-methionine (S)-S-oxide reductase
MTADAHPSRNRRPLLRTLAVAAAVPLVGLGLLQAANGAPEQAVVIPAPTTAVEETGSTATFVLAGGCFWGVQGVFQRVAGVKNAVSGYAGGDASTAKYDLIGTGTTGHAEAVEITYDPSVVNLGELLHIFFSVAHNPTQLNYQGPDRGTQYRTAIFFEDAAEKQYAEEYIAELDAAGVFPAKIVTTLEPLEGFYDAEDYHQDFLTVNPSWPYIVYHDLPKIEALKTIFPDVYRDDPILVSEAGL